LFEFVKPVLRPVGCGGFRVDECHLCGARHDSERPVSYFHWSSPQELVPEWDEVPLPVSTMPLDEAARGQRP
jgi:hypothetical protein